MKNTLRSNNLMETVGAAVLSFVALATGGVSAFYLESSGAELTAGGVLSGIGVGVVAFAILFPLTYRIAVKVTAKRKRVARS